MEITKNQFNEYWNIQKSGVTNMFNVKNVMELTGLTREEILFIMENYEELEERYKQ